MSCFVVIVSNFSWLIFGIISFLPMSSSRKYICACLLYISLKVLGLSVCFKFKENYICKN